MTMKNRFPIQLTILCWLVPACTPASLISRNIQPQYTVEKKFDWRSSCIIRLRGGDESGQDIAAASAAPSSTVEDSSARDDVETEEEDFHTRVQRAMEKLGLSQPSNVDSNEDSNANVASEEVSASEGAECKDGVCTLPEVESTDISSTTSSSSVDSLVTVTPPDDDISLHNKAEELAKLADVSYNVAMAAVIGNAGDVERAEEYLKYEKELIKNMDVDADEVKQLVNENVGYDAESVIRALALAEGDVENAKAILAAEAADAEEEARQEEARQEMQRAQEATEKAMAARTAPKQSAPTVTVPSNFDPTKSSKVSQPTVSAPTASMEDTIFDATASNLFEKVIASPQPVLLDVYATWCGPCKALTPALEDVARKAGGQIRLGKLDTDQERSISSALGVTALPTVFGIYRGKIVDSFQGMPTEDSLRTFLMDLVQNKVKKGKEEHYQELTDKLVKLSALSQFSFASRERLQTNVKKLLKSMSTEYGIEGALAQIQLLRKVLSNITNNLDEPKYQKVNTAHPKLATLTPSALRILSLVGFKRNDEIYVLKKADGTSIPNPAPLVITMGVIDKFLDENRYLLAKIKRQQKDEALRENLVVPVKKSDEKEKVKPEVDPNISKLKVRIQGLRKTHNFEFNKADPFSAVLEKMKSIVKIDEGEDKIQVTCAGKRLVFSCNADNLSKSLEDHGLYPSANIVLKLPYAIKPSTGEDQTSSLADRAKISRERKKGSHTMQSIGIYSSQDNAKGELIDGGSGVLWEHDVSDDEDEPNDANAVEEVENSENDVDEGEDRQ